MSGDRIGIRRRPGARWKSRSSRVVAVGVLALLIVLVAGCDDEMPAAPLLVFGRTGLGPGELSYPRATVMAPEDRLFVVDKGGRIQCFSATGEFLHGWRMPEIAAGKPTGLGLGALLPGGQPVLYVADTHYARVLIFSLDGHVLGSFGSFGRGRGQFVLPTDVAVDRDGFIYVGEYGGNDRVSKFTPDRQYVRSFGGPDSGPAMLQRPQSLLFGPDGTLWVADAGNHRVCHFDTDGKLLGTFGHIGSAPGELRYPYSLDLLSDGTLVVCEYGNNRLQRFDTAGRSLGTWGRPGRAPGELAYPWAAVVGRDDRILIVDSGNNRIQVIDGRAGRRWGGAASGAPASSPGR